MRLRRTSIALSVFIALLAAGCHSGPAGTYKDETGSLTLELKGGGKAQLTFFGKAGDCTYTTSGKQLTLSCNGDPTHPTLLTVQDDGSLAGPPGGPLPTLHKQK